jgi:protein subunit release factor A
MKQLLFSLTAKDFVFETFCTGGKGGQHRNAKQNGVRCIHPDSGARAEHRDGREQYLNKRKAFEKCCNTKEFKAWHKLETMRRLGHLRNIEDSVEKQMESSNIKIEYY